MPSFWWMRFMIPTNFRVLCNWDEETNRNPLTFYSTVHNLITFHSVFVIFVIEKYKTKKVNA